MTHNFYIGQQVRNLGCVYATVDSFHPVTGDPILRDCEGNRWLANSAACEPVTEGWMHRDGLIAID